MPLISVIIPAYNAEKHISQCIDTILLQTFRDYELIVINDGSKDRTLKILRNFEQLDSRIKIYDKTNGGVSSARNLGLSLAKGDWIIFIDADDWVKPDYFETLINASLEGTDLVVDKCEVVYEDGHSEPEKYISTICGGNNFTDVFTVGNITSRTSPWGKLFKRSIIESSHISFNEKVHLGEDAIFLFTYLLKCKIVRFIDNGGYMYRFESNGSLTKKINSIDSEKTAFSEINRLLDEVNSSFDVNRNIHRNFNKLKGYYIRRVLNSLYFNDSSAQERIKIIKRLPLKSYIYNYPVDSIQEKVYKSILNCRLYHCYDLLRFIISKTKKKHK